MVGGCSGVVITLSHAGDLHHHTIMRRMNSLIEYQVNRRRPGPVPSCISRARSFRRPKDLSVGWMFVDAYGRPCLFSKGVDREDRGLGINVGERNKG